MKTIKNIIAVVSIIAVVAIVGTVGTFVYLDNVFEWMNAELQAIT